MTKTVKLSDLQLILLTTASQRDDGSLLPVPGTIADQESRIPNSIRALMKRGLAEERAGASLSAIWREEGDQRMGVVITPAGREAIGVAETDSAVETHASGSNDPNDHKSEPAVRTRSKKDLLLDLIRRDGGATIDELTTATGWLPHTTRAAISGLRKGGLAVANVRQDGISRYSAWRAE